MCVNFHHLMKHLELTQPIVEISKIIVKYLLPIFCSPLKKKSVAHSVLSCTNQSSVISLEARPLDVGQELLSMNKK